MITHRHPLEMHGPGLMLLCGSMEARPEQSRIRFATENALIIVNGNMKGNGTILFDAVLQSGVIDPADSVNVTRLETRGALDSMIRFTAGKVQWGVAGAVTPHF